MSLDVYLSYKEDGNQIGVFDANITHNLTEMADEADIYAACWRPEQLEIDTAKDLIGELENGLKKLKDDPKHYQKFDDPDGWGTYRQFVPWVEEYLAACKKYPSAKIRTSR